MRILYIVDDISYYGGLEKVCLMTAGHISINKGYKVDILSLSQKSEVVFHDYIGKLGFHSIGVEHYTANSKSWGFINPTRKYALFYKDKLQEFVDSNQKYDVIISTLNSISVLMEKISFDGVKIHWEHGHFYGYCDPFSYYKGFKGQLKLVCHKLLTYPLRSQVCKKLDAVVVLTEKDKSEWNKWTPNVYRIYNACTLSNFEQNGDKQKNILSIGRLCSQKGFDYLIRSFKVVSTYHPEYKLKIVGDGPLKDQLHRIIQAEGLVDNVVLCGKHGDIKPFLNESKIYVSSSIYEPFGLVLVEAQAAGLPVVAFDCYSGPSEIITKDSGILVKNRNIQKLANAILYLINENEQLESMSKAALINAERFSIEKISQEWIKLFNTLLSRK